MTRRVGGVPESEGRPNDWLSAKEAAAELGIGYRTFLGLIGDKIPAFDTGYAFKVQRKHLNAYIQANTAETPAVRRRKGRGRRTA